MDAAAHYRRLVQLGKAGFLAAAAPAALVRMRATPPDDDLGAVTLTLEEDLDATLPRSKELFDSDGELEVYALTKKAGASFPDRITIGRTQNNDVAIEDHSVSRLHAYLRRTGETWVVADAGSKNGSWLRGVQLPARRETVIESRQLLRLGDVELTFYLARDLYGALGGS